MEYIANIKVGREELTKNYSYKLAEKYEQKRNALLVVEAKLQFDQGSTSNQLKDLQNEITILKYRHNMGGAEGTIHNDKAQAEDALDDYRIARKWLENMLESSRRITIIKGLPREQEKERSSILKNG